MRSSAIARLVMLPLVAPGVSIGLVELLSTARRSSSTPERLSLARTIANEASIALENARLYEEAPSPRRPRSADRLLQPPLPARAVRPGGRPGPARPPPAQPADARPRRLQARQRHVRPPPRRRRPALDRRPHPADAPGLGHPGPLRRRRVRDPPARRRPRGRRRGPPSGWSRRLPSATFCHDGRLSVPIGISVGVATFPADGRTAAELIAVADAGLYRMKRSRTGPRSRARPDGGAWRITASRRTDVLPPEVPPGRVAGRPPDRHAHLRT